MSRPWREDLIKRDHRGRFAEKLGKLAHGQSAKAGNGVSVRVGSRRQGRRRRKLFSVEGGSVHISPVGASHEAHDLPGFDSPAPGEHTGPRTHTGWLGRYRKMTLEDLYSEEQFLNEGNYDRSQEKVRRAALNSAIAEAEGKKEIKTRKPKERELEKGEQTKFEAAADAARKDIRRLTERHTTRREPNEEITKLRERAERLQRSIDLGRDAMDSGAYSPQQEDGVKKKLAESEAELAKVRQEFDNATAKGHTGPPVISREGLDKIGKVIADLAELSEADERETKDGLYDEVGALEEQGYRLSREVSESPGDSAKEQELARVNARRKELNAKIDKLRDEAGHKAIQKLHLKRMELQSDLEYAGGDLTPRGRKILKKMDEINRQIAIQQRSSADRQQRHLARALAAVREDFGKGEIKVARRSSIAPLFDKAQSLLPGDWIEAMNRKKGALEVRQKSSQRRGHYGDKGAHEIVMPGPSSSRTREARRKGIDLDDLALHEVGHGIEASNSHIVQMEREFYKHRTDGLPLQKLKELVPGSSYKPSEVTRVDDFVNFYMGKQYPDGYFELLTMGLEGVFYDRDNFRDGDPEMYRWMLGLLAAA